jgi:hypothetical protein
MAQAQVLRYDFRLFGPHAGKTIRVNGHQFTDGICRIVQQRQNMEACARVLSKYGAYHRGSEMYDTLLAAEEKANGKHDVSAPEAERADVEVRDEVRPAGQESAAPPADVGSADAPASGGSGEPADGDSNGDGHEHSGVPKFPEDADRRFEEPASQVNEDVRAAVLKLDPENDAHWVRTGAKAGQPKLSAVEEAYGRAGLTRNDIEAALPGWDRQKAFEHALNG